MYSYNNFTNIQSTILLQKIKKRGYKLDPNLKKNLNSIEKYHRNHLDNSYEEICNILGIKLSNEILKLIKLFTKSNNININYIDYIIILDSLDKQEIKNLNRYLLIKWNITKIKFLNKFNENYSSYEIPNNLENLSSYEEIFNQFIKNLENFLDIFEKNNKDKNINLNLHLLFILNNLQECICP